MITILMVACFAFIIVACVEFVILSRLNQLLESNDEEIFFLENERDTLREKVLSLQHEIEDLEYEIQALKTTKTKAKKQEKIVPIEKAPKKRGRKPKAKKED